MRSSQQFSARLQQASLGMFDYVLRISGQQPAGLRGLSLGSLFIG